MYLDRGERSNVFTERVTTHAVDAKALVGRGGARVLCPGRSTPALRLVGPERRYCGAVGAGQTEQRGRGLRRRHLGVPTGEPRARAGKALRGRGGVGEPKGVKQRPLRGRGWFAAGVCRRGNRFRPARTEPGKALGEPRDFEKERTSSQHLAESRGHTLLLSPKCHPGVAWACPRWSFGGRSRTDLRRVSIGTWMVAYMKPRTILTAQRVRRLARLARHHCGSTPLFKDGEVRQWKETIESVKKKCGAHRNTLDTGPGFHREAATA